MIRSLLIVGLAATVTACASPYETKTPKTEPARLPTEQFANTLQSSPDEILLAPHAAGLSPNQSSALAALVRRWRENGNGVITIQAPAGGGDAVYRSVTAVQTALSDMGLPDEQIRVIAYGNAASPGAPLAVSYTRYDVQPLECGRDWKSYTHTFSNQVTNNFGCAVTANLGAMIANPADLANPRTMDPSDAARREVVLGKYRAGQVTSAAKDDQASGAISTAVQ